MKGDSSGRAELQPQKIQCCSYSTYSKNLSVKCNAGGHLLHRDSLFQSDKAQAGGKGSIDGKQSSQIAWKTLGNGQLGGKISTMQLDRERNLHYLLVIPRPGRIISEWVNWLIPHKVPEHKKTKTSPSLTGEGVTQSFDMFSGSWEDLVPEMCREA